MQQTAIDAVNKWIASSTTIEQLNCCLMFVQDTLYIRFNLNKEVDELRQKIEEAKQRMKDETLAEEKHQQQPAMAGPAYAMLTPERPATLFGEDEETDTKHCVDDDEIDWGLVVH